MSPSRRLRSVLDSLRPLRPSWLADVNPTSLASLLAFLERLRERLPALSPRAGWLWYTLACFGFFLLLTFPTEPLLRRVLVSVSRESAVRMHYAEGGWRWGTGWVLRDLTIESPLTRGTALRLSRLTLRPSLIGLLSSQLLPLTFSADLYGGTCSGTVRQEAVGVGVHFALQQMRLDLLPVPAPWRQGQVAGSLTADGEFQGNPADIQSVRGTFTLTLIGDALRAGTGARLPLPALQTVQAHLRATLAGGRLDIAELRLSADGAEAHAQGALTLRTPLTRSVLDLQLTTHITGSPPPALTSLLSLLPAVPGTTGERRASITGSLAAPVVR